MVFKWKVGQYQDVKGELAAEIYFPEYIILSKCLVEPCECIFAVKFSNRFFLCVAQAVYGCHTGFSIVSKTGRGTDSLISPLVSVNRNF